jgi:hypothetical protein
MHVSMRRSRARCILEGVELLLDVECFEIHHHTPDILMYDFPERSFLKLKTILYLCYFMHFPAALVQIDRRMDCAGSGGLTTAG